MRVRGRLIVQHEVSHDVQPDHVDGLVPVLAALLLVMMAVVPFLLVLGFLIGIVLDGRDVLFLFVL